MKKELSRPEEITSEFLMALDNHLADILQGKAEVMLEIKHIADQLNIHPTHLSNTIKLATGKSACSFYENKIIDIAKSLLKNTDKSIAEIAQTLTYDPSNFTKFFKAYANKTPKQYREDLKNNIV